MNREQVIRAQIKKLEDFLKTKPDHCYMGESYYAEDAVECENRENDRIEKEVKTQIKKLRNELIYFSK